MMLNTALILLAAVNCHGPKELWAGKTDTGRSIRLEAVVNATPEEVFKVFTTEQGIQRILAPKLTIDPRVGGRYEVGFAP